MDKDLPRSALDVPLQVSDDGNAVLTDSKQWDLHCDAVGTQGDKSKIGASSSSTGLRRTKRGAVYGCGAPPPQLHMIFCACDGDDVAEVGDDAFTSDNEAGFSDEGDDDDEGDDKGDDTQLSLTDNVRSLLREHAAPSADTASEQRCDAASDQGRDAAPVQGHGTAPDQGHDAALEPDAAPDQGRDAAPDQGRDAASDQGRDAASDAVADDDGRDGGLWDLECNGELDDEEEKAVRQDSFVAPWDSGGGASVAAATAAIGLRPQIRWMIGDDFQAKRSGYTGVLTCREEPPSLPAAPDDASTTGCTYDDITKSPPSHLRCVVSPFSSLSPVLRCTAASLPNLCRRRLKVEPGSGRALCEADTRLFGAWCLREFPCTIVTNKVLEAKESVCRRQDK